MISKCDQYSKCSCLGKDVKLSSLLFLFLSLLLLLLLLHLFTPFSTCLLILSSFSSFIASFPSPLLHSLSPFFINSSSAPKQRSIIHWVDTSHTKNRNLKHRTMQGTACSVTKVAATWHSLSSSLLFICHLYALCKFQWAPCMANL